MLQKEEHKIKNLSKTILQLGQEVGVPMFMHAAKFAFFESARNAGDGDQFWIETLKIWEDMVGVKFGPTKD